MSYVSVPCGTCRACCKGPWFVRLMPWEKDAHGGVDVVPKKENGDCVYLVDEGCSLFEKPERPYVCKTFDCRNKVAEWNARGRPELDEGLAPVIWAGLRLVGEARR
jgi:hypothetical protein